MRYFLEQCIISVKAAIKTIEAEIIVVDNASSDDSCRMVRERFPKVQFIENSENVGFSKANNQGVKVARGEYICILNPDTVVTENIFVDLVKQAKEIGEFGIMGVHLIDGTGNFLAESKRNIPTPKNSFSKMFRIKITKDEDYYANHLHETSNASVPILVGAFMFMKRQTYNEVSGFDEEYFMYGEDIDLSYKMLKKGWNNYYVGNLSVIHYKGESTIRDRVYLERFYGAMQLFYQKHFRTNVFYDAFIKLGIQFSLMTRSLQKTSGNKHLIEEYYLVSDDANLKNNLQKKLIKGVTIISLESLTKETIKNREIIFDNNTISFLDIIKTMKRIKTPQTTFKIRPQGCNFVIGSNSSDSRGDIIVF